MTKDTSVFFAVLNIHVMRVDFCDQLYLQKLRNINMFILADDKNVKSSLVPNIFLIIIFTIS